MTIDEAIKLQNELLRLLPEVGFNKYIASSRLGIEAMKDVKVWRQEHHGLYSHLLPGETEE